MNTTQTISLAMTWEQVAPMLALILEDGNATGRQNAREELARMARAADAAKGWAAELAAMREGLGIMARAARLAVGADASKRDALGELAELAELAEAMTADAPAAVARANAGQLAAQREEPAAPEPRPQPRESDVESALVWAYRNGGGAFAGPALDSYCNARGLFWGVDIGGELSFAPAG